MHFQHTCRREYSFHCVAEWLEWSACLPLTIRLDVHQQWVHAEHIYHRVINILNEHSERWHDMFFDLPVGNLHRLCGSSHGNILCRLVLHYPFSGSHSEPCGVSIFSMKSKPSPTDLTLRTVSLTYVDIAWNNLTVAFIQILVLMNALSSFDELLF